MQIALALSPRFTALDIIGPFQVFGDVPDVEVAWVAESLEPVVDHTGTAHLVPTHTFEQLDRPEVIVVPGGGSNDLIPSLDTWIRHVHPSTTWTTSVSTGSIHLARAGLLEGRHATTHWASAERLEQLGAHYTDQRVVQVGRIVTGAGVSAGIDMALTLLARTHGPVVAQMVQLSIEYDPQPPFDAGAPSEASPEGSNWRPAVSPGLVRRHPERSPLVTNCSLVFLGSSTRPDELRAAA